MQETKHIYTISVKTLEASTSSDADCTKASKGARGRNASSSCFAALLTIEGGVASKPCACELEGLCLRRLVIQEASHQGPFKKTIVRTICATIPLACKPAS